jgi:hypothetical protein
MPLPISRSRITLLSARLRVAVTAALLTAACSGASSDRPRLEYDPESGRLRRIEYDASGNGRRDAVSIMDGTRIRWIELDLDENGKVDRWDFYGPDNKLEKVGFSRQNDGILDAHAFYSAEGELRRIETSTRRDGRFDRVEFYERGVLARGEEDLDGNGQPDKWETYRHEPDAAPGEPSYVITSVAFDDAGRGTPQRRFVYGRNGQVMRVEIDPDGDGQFVVAVPRR